MLLLKARVSGFIERRWYGRPGLLYVLLPLEYLFVALARVRRWRQQRRAYRSSLPLIIVGNISVGGTGKTPLLIALSEHLQAQGYRPAIISRAYKSQAERSSSPLRVTAQHSYREVGDEPLEIYLRTRLPVVVGAERVALVKHIETETDCNVILADDGLQHYRLARDIEIVVIDALRGWGNGHCLPVGPLREPPARAAQATACVLNGNSSSDALSALPGQRGYGARVVVAGLINLLTQRALAVSLIGQLGSLVAVAGMGNPEKFFNTLSEFNVNFTRKVFPDHGAITQRDLAEFGDQQIIMSGKDAVKCREFAQANYWVLEVDLLPEPSLLQDLSRALKTVEKG